MKQIPKIKIGIIGTGNLGLAIIKGLLASKINDQLEIIASKSRISDEIFSFDDFLKWVDEWKKHPDNLLFLRHIDLMVKTGV